jgi:hypothetical protein
VALTPKTVGAFVDYSRRLLMQSSDGRRSVRAHGHRAPDRAGDRPGCPERQRVEQPAARRAEHRGHRLRRRRHQRPALPTWDNIVDLESAVANANAPDGNRAYVTNTKVRGRLKQHAEVHGHQRPGDLDRPGRDERQPRVVSNQVPSNLTKGTAAGICSAIAYGNWADLIIGMWGGLDVLFDPYTGGIAGTKRLVALQDVDTSVRYPVSFAAMLDALTS